MAQGVTHLGLAVKFGQDRGEVDCAPHVVTQSESALAAVEGEIPIVEAVLCEQGAGERAGGVQVHRVSLPCGRPAAGTSLEPLPDQQVRVVRYRRKRVNERWVTDKREAGRTYAWRQLGVPSNFAGVFGPDTRLATTLEKHTTKVSSSDHQGLGRRTPDA